LKGQIRDFGILEIQGAATLMAIRNNDTPQFFSIGRKKK
jgi:hypothetical protein